MPKFFNSSRGPVTATVDGTVIVFPAKQWTVLDDSLGISASLQSLVEQRVLVLSKDSKPLKVAVASKPKPSRSAKDAPSKPSPKPEPSKVAPPKDTPKIQTPEPAPAPVTSSKV